MPVEVVRNAPVMPLAPVDTNVTIPKHVREAAARAEAFYGQPQPDPAPEPQPQPTGQTPEPPPTGQTPEPQPTGQTPPEPAPAPVDEAWDDPNITAEQWKHRALSMRGRLKSVLTEAKTLKEQNAQLGDQLVATQDRVRTSNPLPSTPDAASLIRPEDIANYGDELIDTIKRVAQSAVNEVVGPQISEVRKEVKKSAVEKMEDDLTTAVPNWRAINSAPAFIRWLALPDVYSGRVRQDLLIEAHSAASAPRVAAFFKGFLEAHPPRQRTPEPQLDTQPLVPAPREPVLSLSALAAPGRARPASGGDTPNAPVASRTYTRAAVSKFFNDARLLATGKGPWVGRQAEKDAMERDIFLAENEGRIQ